MPERTKIVFTKSITIGTSVETSQTTLYHVRIYKEPDLRFLATLMYMQS